MGRDYDNNFWLTGFSVNGVMVTREYDMDGLLIQAGDLTLDRDPINGLVTATHLAEVDSVTLYNQFGEIERERITTATSTLNAIVEGQGITSDVLEVTGYIGGVGAIMINGLAMQIGSDGTISGQVPLPHIQENLLDIEVFDANDELVSQMQRTVIRELPQTDYNITRIVEMAPNGDIYFFNDGNNGHELLRRITGTGIASGPDWLSDASDVTVAESGEIYLLIRYEYKCLRWNAGDSCPGSCFSRPNVG
ncbi:MAG: hypothetical protein ABW141_07560 [Candidatus Thiodiazotropha endolucinida]